MKKLLLILFLCGFALDAGAFIKIFKNKEVNPDYTQTYWDKLMVRQSAFDMRRGLTELQNMRYETAVNTFAKALVKNPKDPFAHIFFGMALYWTGRVDAAMAEYREAIKLDENNEEAFQLLGIAYGWKGNTAAAKENFLTADKLNHARPDVKMNLSSVFSAENNLDAAIDYARMAVTLSPKSPLYHFHLGTLFEAIGRDNQAADSFKQAIKLFPGYEDAMLALAAMYEKRGENNDALHYYRRALNLKPGDFVARLRYANLLFVTGAEASARQIVEEAFGINRSSKGGLALDIAYSQNDSSETDNLKKSLSQFSPAQDIEIEMQITYSPKPKLKAAQESASGLEQELARAREEEQSQVFRRLFVLRAASANERAAQIDNISNSMKETFNSAPEGMQAKFAMKVSALESTAPQAASPNKTAYNPRSVGNDMGLWVTGRSWVKFVEEIKPDIEERLEDAPQNFDYILLGLAALTVGDARAAYTAFDNAGSGELALLGKGTAMIVEGKENAAKDFYEQVLKLNPKNKTVAVNLSILNEQKH